MGTLIVTPRFWTGPKARGVLYQAFALGAVILLVYFVARTTVANLEDRGVGLGFDFLGEVGDFAIGFSLIDHDESDTYGRAFVVGLINTFVASAIGIVLATALGFAVGLARLSSNWPLSRVALAFVETVRNVPLLLHIIVWYWVVQELLPPLRRSLSIWDVAFLNNRGAFLPRPVFGDGSEWILVGAIVAVVGVGALAHWAKRRRDFTGTPFPVTSVAAGVLIGVPVVAAAAVGFPVEWDVPVIRGFNFQGGMTVIPELAALVLGLAIYNASFIAEIVRGSIEAISRSQKDAAAALGLRYGLRMRLVVIPQALRIIVPPLTNQYLHLLKGSSLAVAIGYPDLVNVFTGSVLNYTGRAVEIMFMTMAVYLFLSASVALFMNWYNRRVALVAI